MRLKDYLSIREAAQVLGVSAETLRNWDRLGQLRARRHPINNYRLYKLEELKAVLERTHADARPEVSKSGKEGRQR